MKESRICLKMCNAPKKIWCSSLFLPRKRLCKGIFTVHQHYLSNGDSSNLKGALWLGKMGERRFSLFRTQNTVDFLRCSVESMFDTKAISFLNSKNLLVSAKSDNQAGNLVNQDGKRKDTVHSNYYCKQCFLFCQIDQAFCQSYGPSKLKKVGTYYRLGLFWRY